jgi:uncharacterized protein (DUF2384 family)
VHKKSVTRRQRKTRRYSQRVSHIFCTILTAFVLFAWLERESEQSLSRCSPALHNKPDSVGGSHVSGMIVADHLERFYQLQFPKQCIAFVAYTP